MTVDYPATSVHLTRENGLSPRTRYEIEVRARNDHCEGEWSKVSKYIGMFIVYEMLKFDKRLHWEYACATFPLPYKVCTFCVVNSASSNIPVRHLSNT